MVAIQQGAEGGNEVRGKGVEAKWKKVLGVSMAIGRSNIIVDVKMNIGRLNIPVYEQYSESV